MTNRFFYGIITVVPEKSGAMHGGIAQLARALGSYPNGRWFKSDFRYHAGPLVKRLRHGPFTAVTWVRFPYGSPKTKSTTQVVLFCFSISPQSNPLKFRRNLNSLRCDDCRFKRTLAQTWVLIPVRLRRSTTQVVLFVFRYPNNRTYSNSAGI